MKRFTTLVFSAVIFHGGCGTRDDGAQQVGRNVGQAVTDFASGVGQGVDSQLEITVELSPAAAELGLSHTVAKQSSLGSPDGKTISVYFLAQRAVNVSLTAKALNAEGLEIGRRKVDVEFVADDAKYVQFTFDSQMDSQLVHKYMIDVKEAPTGEHEPAPGPAPDAAPGPSQ